MACGGALREADSCPPWMVSTWLWWSRRSKIAVVTTGSPNTVPHSPTARFEVTDNDGPQGMVIWLTSG